MTGKIFRSICVVSLFVLVASIGIILGVSNSYFNDLIMSELEHEAVLISHGVEQYGGGFFGELDGMENRITWVNEDGTVLFDSRADLAAMENHLGREEIVQALENGIGTAVRDSGTLKEKTIYCAVLADNGTVVRVSSVQPPVWELLLRLFRPTVIVIIIAFAVGGLLALRLSQRITRPINGLNLDRPESAKIYPELKPLVNRLGEQNRQIAMQMKELQKKRREFDTIISGMEEGIVIIDHKADILSCNKSALKTLGEPDGDRRNLLAVNRTENVRDVVRHSLSGNHSEERFEAGGRVFRLLGSPVVGDEGVTGAVIFIIDETEKEQRDMLRREFTANISHELKTPLTSISGFAELIKSGVADGDDAVRFADRIHREAARLIALVNDIIELSKLDSGEIRGDTAPVDLYETAKDVKERLEDIAAKRGITIRLSGESAVVDGDGVLLEEMIYNLCDNSIKYGVDGGYVEINVLNDGGRPAVSVADNGIGIEKESQHRVFERFYRVDKSRSKESGGTGLGLSIVKHTAARHGAKIELESEVGVGTTVTVRF